MGGPLLVLAAFGATFRSANPYVTSVLVWPKDGIPGISQEEAAQFIGSSVSLVKVTTDEAEAMGMLQSGKVDLVQVIPDLGAAQQAGQPRPQLQFISKTIDPNAEAWIQSLAYGEANYINQQLLTTEASQAQALAQDVIVSLQNFQTELARFGAKIDPQSIARVRADHRRGACCGDAVAGGAAAGKRRASEPGAGVERRAQRGSVVCWTP